MTTKAQTTIICPACGSEEVAKEKDFRLGYIIGVFLALIPLPLFFKKYHCIDCGNIFREKDIRQITRK
jgi:DNA-directed RNA polymerase subunit RPC12/RpoP